MTSDLFYSPGSRQNKLRYQRQFFYHFSCNNFFRSRYLLDNHWFKQLKKYLNYDAFDGGGGGTGGDGASSETEHDPSSHPGPIDNTPLYVQGTQEIREHLIDDLDYVVIPDEMWKHLVDSFGMTEGQSPIARMVRENTSIVRSFVRSFGATN